MCLRQLELAHTHANAHTHACTIGSFESENWWHRMAAEPRGGGKVELGAVVGASLLLGVTPASGDGAVAAQPNGIHVSITTSQLFCINLRRWTQSGGTALTRRDNVKSCQTFTFYTSHYFKAAACKYLKIFIIFILFFLRPLLDLLQHACCCVRFKVGSEQLSHITS